MIKLFLKEPLENICKKKELNAFKHLGLVMYGYKRDKDYLEDIFEEKN